jgi:tetratricopeptide (TPR) repeat protein
MKNRESKTENSPMSSMNVTANGGSNISNVQQNYIAQQIIYNSSSTSVDPVPEKSKFLVPHQRNPFFTGREEILTNLETALTSKQKVAALSGLGGIGKTHTAIAYAYRSYGRHQPEHILWISAETLADIDNSYVRLAKELEINYLPDEKVEETVKRVKYWLAGNQNCLLIFDNADDTETISKIDSYLPPNFKGKVLITTRLAETRYYAKIKIEKFLLTDGVDFLLKRAKLTPDLPVPPDRSLAEQLVKELDGLPLALDQAGAYIAEIPSTLAEYLQLYRDYKKDLLDEESKFTNDHATTFVTFQIAFKRLETLNLAAAEVIKIAAFLASDDIPEKIFKDAGKQLSARLEEADKPIKWNKIIAEARLYSLITHDPGKKSFSIHRLVQTVIRESLTTEECKNWVAKIANVLSELFPDSRQIDNMPACELLTPQVMSLLKHIQKYEVMSKEVADLLFAVGSYCVDCGLYNLAEPLYNEVLNILQILGAPYNDYANSLITLAGLYRVQCRYKEAENLYKEDLKITQAMKIDHPTNYARSLDNLARLYSDQDRYEDAKKLYEQARNFRKEVLGEKHDDYAHSLNNLAEVHKLQRHYKKAERLYKEALKIYNNAQGQGMLSHNYLSTLNNLALLHQEQGYYKKAERLYKKVREKRKQILEESTPQDLKYVTKLESYAVICNNLAFLYNKQGHYEKAVLLYKETLDLRQQALSTNHPSYAVSLSQLAGVYKSQEQYSEAEQLYEKAVGIFKQVLGTFHPHYAQSLNNLAELYYAQKKYGHAEQLYKEALSILESILGKEHRDCIRIRSNLADLQRAQKK